MTKEKILIIDDEPDIGLFFSKILSREGYQVFISMDGEEGISKIKNEKIDLVFLDLKLPGMDGIEVLREIRRFDRNLLVIILTAYGTVRSAVEAMRLGAYDYLAKPVDIKKIIVIIKNALKTQAIAKTYAHHEKTEKVIEYDPIIGKSPQMKKVLKLVKRVAPHDITVFLGGESGTGKELIAQEIHKKSKRADKPFVVIDCAILPDALVESEIFGHEKGAFTGAHEKKLGKFELAQGGTVFLDEIGNLTNRTQEKLLRVLQEKEIERLGGKKPIKVDFRLIVATNINIERAIKTGCFREDLYYRLNVFPIFLPLLRDRERDVNLLAEYYLTKFSNLFKKEVKYISPEAIELLNEYSWPGNVRELMNVIESAVVQAENKILAEHLPQKIQDFPKEGTKYQGYLRKVGREAKRKAEREVIIKVLEEVNWNKRKASKILNVDYKTLYVKIKEYNIRRD